MRKPIICLLSAATLAGCSQSGQPQLMPPTVITPATPSSATGPVTPTPAMTMPAGTVNVSRMRVATIAKAVLGGLEAVASAYVLTGTVSSIQQTQIAKAEVLAESFVDQLASGQPIDVPTTLTNAAIAINAFVNLIPPGRVPVSVTAGISAVTVLVETIAPLLQMHPGTGIMTPGGAPPVRIVS